VCVCEREREREREREQEAESIYCKCEIRLDEGKTKVIGQEKEERVELQRLQIYQAQNKQKTKESV